MDIKQALQNGKQVFGTWCLIPSPEVINILAKAGLDFVLIDMEHGPMDFVVAQRMVLAAEAEGCEAIIRVPRNDEVDILRALDTGTSGVVVPHIESASDCARAISYMKYPPVGVRGFSPYSRAGGYTSRSDHTVLENARIITGIIVEGKFGFENIASILDNHELDLVYIGTYDLSAALGVPGETRNKKVLEFLESSVTLVRQCGKAAGCLFHDLNELDYFREIGVQFLAYKVDSSVLYDGFSFVRDLKA